MPARMEGMYALFESIEKGSADKLKAFLVEAAYKYEVGIRDLVYRPGRSLWEFADWRVIMVQAPRASVRPGGLPAGVGWALIAVRLGTVGVNSLSASPTCQRVTPTRVGVVLLGRRAVCHVRRSSVVTWLRSVGLGGWATGVRWATSPR